MQFPALLIKDPKVRNIYYIFCALVVTEDKDAVVQGNKKVSPSNFSNMTCLFIQQKKKGRKLRCRYSAALLVSLH